MQTALQMLNIVLVICVQVNHTCSGHQDSFAAQQISSIWDGSDPVRKGDLVCL